MNNSYFSKIILGLICVTFLSGCGFQSKKTTEIDDPTWTKNQWEHQYINLQNIIPPTDWKPPGIVWLYNGYDCMTCVDAGYQAIKHIDSLLHKQIGIIISTLAHPSFDQKRNNYYQYTYTDDKDQIRKELKYIPTPVLLLLDSTSRIKAVFEPKDWESPRLKAYLNYCIRDLGSPPKMQTRF